MTTAWVRAAVVGIVASSAFASVSLAQPPGASSGPPPVYAQIAPVLTLHAEGEQYHRASPPLEGATFGASLALGVRVAPVLAIEGEVLFDRPLSAPQADVYTSRVDYTAESRDTVLGVNLRFRPPGRSRVEFVAGAGMAFSRFARRDVVATDFFRGGGVTRGADRETSTRQPTVSGSMAVTIPLSPRVELAPSVGARWIERKFDTDAWYFGVGRYMAFVSVALRVTPTP